MVQTKLKLNKIENINTESLALYTATFKAMQDVKDNENKIIIEGLTNALIRLMNKEENVIIDGEFKY